MGFLDEAKDRLTEAVDQHGDRIGEGLDKAGDLLDERTGGEDSGQIDTRVDLARDALDGLDGRDDQIAEARPLPP